MLDHVSEPAKHAVDLLSIGTLLAALFQWVPEFTALLVLIWTAMRIYESWLTIVDKRRRLMSDAKPPASPPED